MELKSNLSDQDFLRLSELYIDSFPPEERRPDDSMIPDVDSFVFYGISDKDELIGLLTLWRFDSFNYIEHFAVFPEKRNFGYGSKILGAVPTPVVLEVEPAEYGETAARRIEFYKRNGFRELNCDYSQPPYSAGQPSVRLRLMVKGELSIGTDEIIRTLHRNVYNVAI